MFGVCDANGADVVEAYYCVRITSEVELRIKSFFWLKKTHVYVVFITDAMISHVDSSSFAKLGANQKRPFWPF